MIRGEAPALELVGLRRDDQVRFRKATGGRWKQGTVTGRERDGSVALRDERGASRAIAPERLEVRRPGPRGGTVWRPVAELAASREQLTLWP